LGNVFLGVGGWFHTGDAAAVHPDGSVEIRDRLKDVIISGGENISSVEVEGALLRHPAVREVAIVGMPDESWGEAPHAFVVLKVSATATETKLRNYARDHLAYFKCPQRIQFVSELPKTATEGPEVCPSRQAAGHFQIVMAFDGWCF
jgi:fatty-acyl-CoA synthase